MSNIVNSESDVDKWTPIYTSKRGPFVLTGYKVILYSPDPDIG